MIYKCYYWVLDIPRSIPTILGFGGGRYLWAKYPANNKASIDDPEKENDNEIYCVDMYNRMNWLVT